MSQANDQTRKPCVVCGLDLSGKPRTKDSKGQYACPEFARTRQRCALAPGLPVVSAVDDDAPLSGLLELAEAEAAAVGEHSPIALEPADDLPRSCPVCARSFAPDSESCSGCGFRREIGIKSSMLLKKTKTEQGQTVVCPKCGYDMGAGASILCPECGTRAPLQTAREREQKIADAVRRQAYTQPLITFAACFSVMLVYASVIGSDPATGMARYAIGFAISMVFGWLAYNGMCLVALGFDAPQHLIILRLAAVYTASDLAFAASGYIPIPLLPWIFALLTYLSLLMYYLEMELSEAMLLAVVTFIAKVIALLIVVAWLMGVFVR